MTPSIVLALSARSLICRLGCVFFAGLTTFIDICVTRAAFVTILLTFSGVAEAKAIDGAVLTGSDGAQVKLSRFQGKPVVLFYEDRQSTTTNKPLKVKLLEWGKSQNLLNAAHVVAIANLKAFNFFPAKNLALQYVRSMEKRVGIPILVDLEGTMSDSALHLPAESSTVVLLDSSGTVIYQKTGPLDERDTAEVFASLEKLLR
jgi:hypothetical protein